MTTLKEFDLRFDTQFDKKFGSVPIGQYLDYIKTALSPEFKNLQLLIPQFEAVLKGTTVNLIDINIVLAVLKQDTEDKIIFLLNHIVGQVQHRKNSLDGETYSFLSKEVANLGELCTTYVNFRRQHKEDLLKYVEYNNYIHQGGDKITFLQYKDR